MKWNDLHKKDTYLFCRDMSRKQLQVSFSNKHILETYLDGLLKKHKTKKRVPKILNMKKLFLNITETKNKETKHWLGKEYHKNPRNPW